MKRTVALALWGWLFGVVSVSVAETLVDLTHPFDETTIYWPTAPEGFVLQRGPAGRTPFGYYYEAHSFRAPEHGGTHVDAPVHFAEGRLPVDQIPLERLVGEAVTVDVAAACENNRDYRVTIADLLRFEDAHGPIPPGAIVLLRTGFGRWWPDRQRYLGTAERGEAAVRSLRFPGLSGPAARWLAAERRVSAVGIDTASIDFGRSRRFPAHVALLERNVPVFENLANLDRLPPRGFRVIALPMKIRGGSGGPLRAIAILPNR
jgi:kynurenine formamidase